MMTIPLAVTLIGAGIYILAGNAKVSEMGRIAYFVGLLLLVAELAHHSLALH